MKNVLDDGNMDLIKIGEFFMYINTAKDAISPVYFRAKVDIIGKKGEFGLSVLLTKCPSLRRSIVAD